MRSVVAGALDRVDEDDDVSLRYLPREASEDSSTLVVTGEVKNRFAALDGDLETDSVIVETSTGSQYKIHSDARVFWRESPSRFWSSAGSEARVEQVATDGGDA